MADSASLHFACTSCGHLLMECMLVYSAAGAETNAQVVVTSLDLTCPSCQRRATSAIDDFTRALDEITHPQGET